MSITQGDVMLPCQIAQAVKALFSALGTPCAREPWSGRDEEGCGVTGRPCRALPGHDAASGYTENRYRGDHTVDSVCYTEDREGVVLRSASTRRDLQ